MKQCTKCGELKPASEFYRDKKGKDQLQSMCKECGKDRYKTWWDTNRNKTGHESMYENKSCALYLGVVIGERLCRHLFKDVEVMPHNNKGHDIICNKNKKIDIKSGCLLFKHGKTPRWQFDIRKNTIPDYFICVAFDNRIDLNPVHLWMFPGTEINKKTSHSISPLTIHKWDKWERSIEDVQSCCTVLKEITR